MPPSPQGSLASLAAAGRRRLEAAGFDAERAGRDAVLLARWILGWEAARWLTGSSDTPPPAFSDRFFHLIQRRAASEPVAYLTGEREFYGRVFSVTRDVLIPRPETEFVVEEALQCLSHPAPSAQRPAPCVVDVGTGSGCLAITLALERPDARITATDISQAALRVARDNAQRLGAGDRVDFREGPFLAGLTAPPDVIVSNPPYVAESDRSTLPLEVVSFEPAHALFGGGADGLDMIRALLPMAAAALAPGGWLVMEIGYGQLDAVRRVVEQTHALFFSHARADLQGIPRVVVLRSSKFEV
jgi:release factor glutamine methyltransferase